MGKYSWSNHLSKKKCKRLKICHECGGSLKITKTVNGKYLYKLQCELCFKSIGGKFKNNPINPNFKKLSFKKNKKFLSATYKEFLNSPQWRKRREEVLIKDDYRCYFCGSKEFLNVHHLNYKELLGNDLKTLCHQCHTLVHDIEKHSKRFEELDKFKSRILAERRKFSG